MITADRKTAIVIGLVFGDEGKATAVDWLVREMRAKTVVRFNGGPQAAHHVVLPNGIWHPYSQFGSGTFVPGVETFLSSYTLVDPLAVKAEEKHLRSCGVDDAFERLVIDPDCVVITPIHRFMNRLRELTRRDSRHGSCGMGVGEAWLDHSFDPEASLKVGDLSDPRTAKRKVRALIEAKREEARSLITDDADQEARGYFERLFRSGYANALIDEYVSFIFAGVRIAGPEYLKARLEKSPLVFEGAQGVLLDPDIGFRPHVTKTRTTPANAFEILDAIGESEATVYGALRAYGTRHGRGPFPSQDCETAEAVPETHNGTNDWQEDFRIGMLDLVLARYALEHCNSVDELILTNVDRLIGMKTVKAVDELHYKSRSIRSLSEIPGQRPVIAEGELKPSLIKPFEGWNRIISKELSNFIEYIESKRGLAKKVGIISHGPTHLDKIKR